MLTFKTKFLLVESNKTPLPISFITFLNYEIFSIIEENKRGVL